MTTLFAVKMQTYAFTAILLAIISTTVNVDAYSKYNRGCNDINCLSDQVCVIARDECTANKPECGTYPTCISNGAKETCRTKMCEQGTYCKTEDGVPKCIKTNSGLDELLSGVLDGPTPTNNQKTGQQLQSGQSDSNPAQPADNSNKPNAPSAPSAPGYPPGSAYPPGGAAYPQNVYPGYPQYPGPPPPGGYPNANGAPNPYPYAPPNGYQNVYPQLPPNGFPNPGTYNPNYPPPPNGVPPYQGGYNPYGGSPPPTTTKKPSLAEQLTKGLTSLAKQYLKEAAIGALKDKLN